MNTKGQLFSRLLLMSISLIVTLVVLEVALRVFQYQRGRTFEDTLYGLMYRDSFFVGPTFKPHAKGPWQGIPEITIDPYGFRSTPFSLEKPEGQYRILTLGGSTSHAGSYPDKLQSILSERFPERDIRVINAAVPTWNSTQSLIQFITRVVYLEPDMVIFYHAINDMTNTRYRWLTDLPMVDYEKYSGFIQRHSILYNFLKVRLSKLSGLRKKDAWKESLALKKELSENPRVLESVEDSYQGFSPEVFVMNVRNLVALTHLHGITPVFITMPKRFKAGVSRQENLKVAGFHYATGGYDKFLVAIDTHNYHLRKIAADHSIQLVDTANSPLDGNFDLFDDLCHLNEDGAKTLATEVADSITSIIESSNLKELADVDQPS